MAASGNAPDGNGHSRAASAGQSRLHLEMLRMAIEDPDLADVWPPFAPGLSVKKNRQYLYANIIYQFQQPWMRLSGHSDEEVLDTMRYLFTSPVMREYWKAAERARALLEPGTDEYELAQKVDEVWQQYEAVVAAGLHTVTDLRERSDPSGSDPDEPEAA